MQAPMHHINGFSIATSILFFLSTIFVIQPLSLHVPLLVIGRMRITISPMTVPITAILILWAAQCISATETRDGIVGTDGIEPYSILILFICLAYMAITLDITGILQAVAFWVSNQGGNNGRKLYFYFDILLTSVSVVIGNNPVILSGVIMYYTSVTCLELMAWLIAEFAAASMVLFIGNPTNVVICEGFQVNNAAFTAYTILPFIVCSLACYAAFAFQLRNVQHIPPTFAVRGKLYHREALLDPVRAIFDGILLLTCFTLVIVLNFIHVDVWKIVLLFAVAKFIFGLSWDHYRFTHGRIAGTEVASDVNLMDDKFSSGSKWIPSGELNYIIAVGQTLTNIKFYILYAKHTILLYSGMPWLENGQRYLVTTFRQFTSGISSQGHSSRKDWTSSGNPRPDDIVDVAGALRDINLFMEIISRAVQNGHDDWRFLKLIVERSDSLWDQFINMPHRTSPIIRKSIEAYRLILLDVNEAIHSHSSISPNRMDEFNFRLKEFERDLVAIQFELMRLPDNPSQHQSFYMFKDSRNLVITGGNFIQSGPSDRYDRQLAKMMLLHYLTLGVLFGLVWQARSISSLFNP